MVFLKFHIVLVVVVFAVCSDNNVVHSVEDVYQLLLKQGDLLLKQGEEMRARHTGSVAYEGGKNAGVDFMALNRSSGEFVVVGKGTFVEFDDGTRHVISCPHVVLDKKKNAIKEFIIKAQNKNRTEINFDMSLARFDNITDILIVPITYPTIDIFPVKLANSSLKLGDVLYSTTVKDGITYSSTCTVNRLDSSVFGTTCGGERGFSGSGYLNYLGELLAIHEESIFRQSMMSREGLDDTGLKIIDKFYTFCRELLETSITGKHINEQLFCNCMNISTPLDFASSDKNLIACLNEASQNEINEKLFSLCAGAVVNVAEYMSRNSGATVIGFSKMVLIDIMKNGKKVDENL